MDSVNSHPRPRNGILASRAFEQGHRRKPLALSMVAAITIALTSCAGAAVDGQKVSDPRLAELPIVAGDVVDHTDLGEPEFSLTVRTTSEAPLDDVTSELEDAEFTVYGTSSGSVSAFDDELYVFVSVDGSLVHYSFGEVGETTPF